jgi:hypothetical protein
MTDAGNSTEHGASLSASIFIQNQRRIAQRKVAPEGRIDPIGAALTKVRLWRQLAADASLQRPL